MTPSKQAELIPLSHIRWPWPCHWALALYTVLPAHSCTWIPWWFLFVFIHLYICMCCSVCICGEPCVYVWLCTWVCLSIYACVCVHVEARNWCRAFPSTSPHLSFWDNVIHCTVGHRFRYAGWPVNPGAAVSVCPAEGLQMFTVLPGFLHECWGFNLKSSYFPGNHFMDWAIPLAPW